MVVSALDTMSIISNMATGLLGIAIQMAIIFVFFILLLAPVVCCDICMRVCASITLRRGELVI